MEQEKSEHGESRRKVFSVSVREYKITALNRGTGLKNLGAVRANDSGFESQGFCGLVSSKFVRIDLRGVQSSVDENELCVHVRRDFAWCTLYLEQQVTLVPRLWCLEAFLIHSPIQYLADTHIWYY